MKYPFTLYGRIVQIHRYRVEYTEAKPWLDDGGNPAKESRTEYCNTEEQAEAVADAHEGTVVTKLDSSLYEWMDGMEVADVPDTYEEAVKIYEMGQEAWETQQNTPTAAEDSAAMLVDHEYRLTLLELGVE